MVKNHSNGRLSDEITIFSAKISQGYYSKKMEVGGISPSDKFFPNLFCMLRMQKLYE